jgi:uncharacterized protein (DUF2235 family)
MTDPQSSDTTGAAGSHSWPKRLVVCLDGTWNHPASEKRRDDGDRVFKPTNVLKTARAVRKLDTCAATLELTGQPKDGDTVTISGKTYRFAAALTNNDGHVQVGRDADQSLDNLRAAINTEPGHTRYADSTTHHPLVEARGVYGKPHWLQIFVRPDSASGNPFAVQAELTNGHWIVNQELARRFREPTSGPYQGTPQIAYYDIGVGGIRRFPGVSNRVHGLIDRVFGGARGAGFEQNVEDAYTFLTHNYAPDDQIYVFGFSRGAAGARGLCRFIDWMGGILPKAAAYWIPRYFDSFLAGRAFDEVRREIFVERVKRGLARGMDGNEAHARADRIVGTVTPTRIRFLGIWDTVLTLGKRREKPHVDLAPPAAVEHARQALAIDERRPDFIPRVWTQPHSADQTLKQRWFAGVHSNIGGGYVHDGLANVTLHWMLEEANACGLGLDWDFLKYYKPYPQDQLYNSRKLVWKVVQAATFRWRKGVRPIQVDTAAGLSIHESVFTRLAASRDGDRHQRLDPYRPKNLLSFLADCGDHLDELIASIEGLKPSFQLPDEVMKAIKRHAG